MTVVGWIALAVLVLIWAAAPFLLAIFLPDDDDGGSMYP